MEKITYKKSCLLFLVCASLAGCGGSIAIPSDPSDVPETDNGLGSVQVVDPVVAEPRSAESAAALNARGDAVYVDGNFVYRGASAGLVIGELDEKGEKLLERSVLYLPDASSDVLVYKGVAFVASGPRGVVVVDVADVGAPKAIALIKTGGAALRLDRHENRLLVANGSAGVLIVDVTNPRLPKPLAVWRSEGYVRHALLQDGVVYAAEGKSGVSKLNYDGNSSLVHVWRFDTEGQARAVFSNGSRLLVADGHRGVAVLSIAGEKPTELGRVALEDMARDVASKGDGKAFVASGDDGIIVVDSSQPDDMKIVTTFVPERPANRLRVMGDRLYVGNDSAGLLILDISNPEAPSKVFPKAK